MTRLSAKSSSPITGILDITPASKRKRNISKSAQQQAATVKMKTTEKEKVEKGLSSEEDDKEDEDGLGNSRVVLNDGGEEDLGPYDWLDGEIMRLNNEIIEWGMGESRGNNNNGCNEKVRCTEDHNHNYGSNCSSSVNSALEMDQWLNWDWDHQDNGSMEGCSLDQWELEEISSWVMGN
uniref:Uncharacterized protein n=2 Tax=Cucumis sativus TaxID=3659 RepID=A0A0A0LAP1_CUCSA